LGVKCRYDGSSKFNPQILNLAQRFNILGMCPEIEAGLKIPHLPLEIRGSYKNILKGECKIVSKEGEDLTAPLLNACFRILSVIKSLDINICILKSKSPLCGKGKIYDGSFKGRLIKGDGLLSFILEKNGIKVISDEEFNKCGFRKVIF